MNPAPARGRFDAMTIYGVKRLFRDRSPRDVASMMAKAGFVAAAWEDGSFVTMLDVDAPLGLTRLPIRWYCVETAAGTEVRHFSVSALQQRRMEAFLRAVADGDLASIPELVAAMRLTETRDGHDAR